MASQAHPPLPMTKSLCPVASASASLRQTSSNEPAFASKNFSVMEALSWHLRRTDSLNCREEIGDKTGAGVDTLLGPQRARSHHVASVVVIRRARAFSGDDGRSQWWLRVALLAE